MNLNISSFWSSLTKQDPFPNKSKYMCNSPPPLLWKLIPSPASSGVLHPLQTVTPGHLGWQEKVECEDILYSTSTVYSQCIKDSFNSGSLVIGGNWFGTSLPTVQVSQWASWWSRSGSSDGCADLFRLGWTRVMKTAVRIRVCGALAGWVTVSLLCRLLPPPDSSIFHLRRHSPSAAG